MFSPTFSLDRPGRAAPYLQRPQASHWQVDQETTADEFPTLVVLRRFERGAHARSHAGAGDATGAATDQVKETYSQDARAVAVAHWAAMRTRGKTSSV